MIQRRKSIKVIVGLFLFGLFLAFASYTGGVPPASDLVPISGTLMSIETKRKGLLLFELDRSDKRFGYVSFGRTCGSMHEKLDALKGKQITVYYDPNLVKPLSSQNYYGVYEFRADGKEICSYADIFNMHEREISFGLYGGLCLIFFSLAGLLLWMMEVNAAHKKEFQPEMGDKNVFTRKIEADERERQALEEGARVIGDQWRK